MKEISVYPGFWTGILHFLHGMNRSIKGYPMHRNERQAHSDDSIPVIGNAGALQRMYGYVRAL